MKFRTCIMMLVALIVCLCASIAGAQTKPNFSGTWKMNPEKSKFERGGPDRIQSKIEHKDAAIAESLTVTNQNGDRTVETKYTIGDKETPQEVMGRSAQTSAKWDGDGLIIEWKTDDGFFRRKLTLSPDGKTLTMVVTQSRGSGEQAEDTVVFEKQ
jgi:hypothetical protein